MNPRLHVLFQALEVQRDALLKQLRQVQPAHLNRQQNNKWSISQVLGHVIQAERMSVNYMTKKINAIDQVGNTGLWGQVKLGVFIISQRLPLKYKAPKNLGDSPPTYQDMDSLIQDWDDTRQSLKEFLEGVPDNGLSKKIYRHPVMGRCNVVHALKFFQEHLGHHYPQITRQL